MESGSSERSESAAGRATKPETETRMRYHYFKKSSTRALILLGGTSPVRATSSDGQMVERAELQLVAEVDARLADRLTMALNESLRLGDKMPARMRWIVMDFRKHFEASNEPWMPTNWHRYAIGEVPAIGRSKP